MKSILITGGAGFIGSHTSLVLLERGYYLYLIDSCENSKYDTIERVIKLATLKDKNLIKNINFMQGDMRNKDFLKNVFNNAKRNGNDITSVIHFAGLKSVEESIREPLMYWEINLLSTINLLNVMAEFSCYVLIFSSSAAIYSSSNKSPIKENSVIQPISPYGRNKYSIELILQDLFDSCPEYWKIVNLRYFNPIGAHESGMLGENPRGIPSNIFPLINRAAFGQLKNIEIYGNDWHTKDGTGVRDYIHIMDLAEGHIRALEVLKKGKNQILNINLGTGTGTSVLELINNFQDVNKINVPYIYSQRREGDNAICFADNTLAKKILNWEPRRNLRNMCRDGWLWHKWISKKIN